MSRFFSGSRCLSPIVICSLVACLLILHLYSSISHINEKVGNIQQSSFHPLLSGLAKVENKQILLNLAPGLDLFNEYLNVSSPFRYVFFPDGRSAIDPRKDVEKNRSYYYPGRIWLDTDGNPIQAHGGGILYDKRSWRFYWYGEYKNGPTYHAKERGTARVDVIGVGCYSSTDIWTWKYEGIVLAAVEGNEAHDLHKLNVLERPKVIYNEKTGKYVMWMHIDDPTYDKASVGIAISDSPTGPFKYLYSRRPHGFDSRDMTIFKDEDDTAYIIYSSIRNKELHIGPLNQDYLDVTSVMRRALIGQYREAPAVFKYQGLYYMVTSGCSGWAPNEALVHVAESVLGPWETIGNPCIGGNKIYRTATFFAQSTFVLPMPDGLPGSYIFMADRWNPANLRDSRYVWLPLMVSAIHQPSVGLPSRPRVSIFWHERWRLPHMVSGKL